jgi:hypothetical protein
LHRRQGNLTGAEVKNGDEYSLEYPVVSKRIILKCDERFWIEPIWFMAGQVSGCCKHNNGFSSSIKGNEFPDQLSNYRLLKKDSGPWS